MTGFGEVIARLERERKPYAIATIVKVEGSSLGKPGFKIVVDDEGRILYGTLGGVCPEGPIVSVAVEAIKQDRPRLVSVHLVGPEESVARMAAGRASEDEVFVETFCGGRLEIFVEPRSPRRRLVIVAQGGRDDVEEALVSFGRILGFETVVVNPSPALTVEPDVLITDLSFDIGSLNLGERDYVVVLTKGGRDLEVLESLSRTKVGYVGLVASRKRVARNLELLRSRGVSEEFIRSLSAPAGIDIGAYTPEEVALAVVAEVVAKIRGVKVRRKGEEEQAQAPTQTSTPEAAGEVRVVSGACEPSPRAGA
ncbi:MAG: XdhC family protein [Nitrososphaeria archaeon]|nr:XdhC family protein [Nitrososphaeria archaeon]